MGEFVSMTVEGGIATVSLDAPGEKVNVMRHNSLRELASMAERLACEPEVRAAIVLSAKERGFIAGVDIGEIEAVTEPAEASALAREGQRVFALWAALPIPVVAAVHGHCLGGGTEFALACHFRIAAENAAFSLPEIRLGIYPAFGGTQRLPRLISLAKALDLILTGRTIRPPEALAIGFVDRVVPTESLRVEAEKLARQAVSGPSRRLLPRRPRRPEGWKTILFAGTPLGRKIIFRRARRQVLEKTGGHYPAPLQAIEVMRRGLALPLPEALDLEARMIGPVATGPVCKNLIHVFHLSQRPKKHGARETALPLHRAAVLGAGVMGSGIARLFAANGIPVLLKDVDPEAVRAGLDRARESFHREARKKGAGEDWVAARMAMITGTTAYDGFHEVDLVVEAVVEQMAVKQAVLQEVENFMRPEAVFATNTSALSVSELQQSAARPQRIAGLHFFNPVDRLPLVEVVRGGQTDGETVDFLFARSLRLGKTPVLTADRPGFLVNRILMAYLNEAGLLAEGGVSHLSLDRLATGFGLPMGPFRLLDEIGIDIAAEVGRTLSRAFPYLPESTLLKRAAAAGVRGKKGERGFYIYHHGKPVHPDRETEARLHLKKGRPASDADFERMLFLMVNEAARALDEGVVAEAADVDTGIVFGTGFPPFRGGLCRWADQVGLARIVAALEKLAAAHGPRFTPSPLLRTRSSFYA